PAELGGRGADPLDFKAGHGQALGELLDRLADLDPLAQPLDTDLHVSSLFRPVPSTKLPQEAKVVLEEDPQIIDAVAQHGKPLQAGAKGVAGITLGIDADVAEDLWMHHAAAEHFQPAGVLAEIGRASRREWSEAREAVG